MPITAALVDSTAADLRVHGASLVAYRLYDVGYSIHIDRALDLLSTNAPERVRPLRGEAQALQIPNPPVTIVLGSEPLALDGRAPVGAEVSARIFDFGAVSLRLTVAAPDGVTWAEYTRLGNAIEASPALGPAFTRQLRTLAERIAPVVERPLIASAAEEYMVYRVARLVRPDGSVASPDLLSDDDVAPLLLNEPRPLAAAARRELLPHRFSYYPDDLAILTWDNALIVEPHAQDSDVQFLLEFANAQLLELRYYDRLLDAELPRMYDRITALRARGRRALLRRRYAPLLGELQAQVADSTEIVERVENALKVTDDVYLARVYAAALEIFRARAWRAGIDRKLGIIRETYQMLNAESQAARAEALEAAIVVLIVAELVLGLLRR